MNRSKLRLTLLIVALSLLVSLPRTYVVRAQGVIYIRPDGSVEGTTRIERVGDVYSFTDNIYDTGGIVIERSNLVIDGRGYTLQGSGDGNGFDLYNVNNVTIQNTKITNFTYGVSLYLSNNSTISKNNIVVTSNGFGVALYISSYNSVTGNDITSSIQVDRGIELGSSSFNIISGNIITNTREGIRLDQASHNNIIYDGTIASNDFGIVFSTTSLNTVSGSHITNNNWGIYFWSSSNNTISRSIIADNTLQGIYLSPSSSNNTVTGNTLSNNGDGIYVWNSSSNRIHQNNFIGNTQHVYLKEPGYTNAWNASYPSGGNYWDTYSGVDLYSGPYQNVPGGDGLGETPHTIDADNTDEYPLMGMFSSFNAFPGYCVNVVSNSTIENFTYFQPNSTIKMHVSNTSSTQLFGFCRVAIPKGLMAPPYTVTIDRETAEVLNLNDVLFDNGTHRWIYFAYEHSLRDVEIQGFIPPDTTPPTISILSPENKAYPAQDVQLTFAVSEPTIWVGYSLDGQGNMTTSGNTTLIELSEGPHTLTVYANDTAGNMGSSNTVYFTIDTISPTITMLSPENKTYTTTYVSLNFTIDEATSWIGYSLDGQMNITITGNTTLSELSDGSHSLVIYANDTARNTGTSETRYFGIETPPPAPEPFPLWGIVAIVITAVAVAVLLIYFVRTKKQKGRPHSD